MTRKLFIAAIDKNSGKTTTSIGLMHLALQKYKRVGFIKPFGGQSVSHRGKLIDKDVALMAQIFHLNRDLDLMSPVVLLPDTTRKVIDGEIAPADLEERILHAFGELEKKCDFIIIEGSGHPGVGSILKLSNARVAHLLDAPVLIVTGGGLGNVVDRLSMIMTLFNREQVDVRAILVNRLLAEKREQSLDYLRRALENEPYRVLGGLDYQPALANPTLRRVAMILDLEVHGNKHEMQRIIYKVLVGAASTQRIVELLAEPTLILVTSSRDELLVTLANLYQMPQYRSLIVGLIISGSAPVNAITQQILDKSNICYMRTNKHVSAELYQIIGRDESKIIAEDREKLELIRDLTEKSLDFDEIDRLFSEHKPSSKKGDRMSNSESPLHCVVVGCLVRNDKNQVLLIRHHKRGWEIPQGRVEEGENLIDALHREVREEAGVEIEAGPLAAVWSMVTLPPAIIFTFLGRYKSGNLNSCGDKRDTGDSRGACWTTESQALEMITVPVMRERLVALLNFNGTTIYRSYSTKPYLVHFETNFGESLIP